MKDVNNKFNLIDVLQHFGLMDVQISKSDWTDVNNLIEHS